MKSNAQYKQTEIGEIPEDWKIQSLGDVAFFQNGKSSPNRNINGKYPVYGSNGRIGFSNKSNSEPGSIVIGRVGSYCGSLYLTDQPSWITDNAIKATSKNKNDSRFIFYLLHTLNLNSRSGGSGQPLLNQQILQSILIASPNLSEQQQIASILSSLDDKIELNRRMNKTLEEIGKALFKRWFVDFEFPNDNGDPYKSSGGEMVESELGEIPKGWKVGNLSDEFEILMGQSPPGSTYNENGNGLPFYQGRTDFGERFPSRRMFCSAPTRIAKKFDTLLSVRAPVGDINQANEECCIGRGVASIRKENHPTYTFYKLLYLKNIFLAYDKEGTVFGSINKTDLSKIQIILPPTLLVTMFEKELGIIDKQIFSNTTQIENLTNMRNSLLPRLMSGRIRV